MIRILFIILIVFSFSQYVVYGQYTQPGEPYCPDEVKYKGLCFGIGLLDSLMEIPPWLNLKDRYVLKLKAIPYAEQDLEQSKEKIQNIERSIVTNNENDKKELEKEIERYQTIQLRIEYWKNYEIPINEKALGLESYTEKQRWLQENLCMNSISDNTIEFWEENPIKIKDSKMIKKECLALKTYDYEILIGTGIAVGIFFVVFKLLSKKKT